MRHTQIATCVTVFFLSAAAAQAQDAAPGVLRAGMIGLDTSHVVAFTREINKPNQTEDLAGLRIVAGYPGGTDFPPSATRGYSGASQSRPLRLQA